MSERCSGLEFRLQMPADTPSLEGLDLSKGQIVSSQLPFCTMEGHSIHTPGQGMRSPGAEVFRAGTSGLGAMLEGEGTPPSLYAPCHSGLDFLWPHI